MSKMMPQLYRVIVRTKTLEKMTSGGIEIPEQALQREAVSSTEGIIVSMGPIAFNAVTENGDPRYIGATPKVGDHVVFAKHAGSNFKRDDIEYRILNDEDILAVEEFSDNETPSETIILKAK